MQRQIGPISHQGPSEPCHLWLPSVLWSSDGVFLGDLWVGVVLVYYFFLNVPRVEWRVVVPVFRGLEGPNGSTLRGLQG